MLLSLAINIYQFVFHFVTFLHWKIFLTVTLGKIFAFYKVM